MRTIFVLIFVLSTGINCFAAEPIEAFAGVPPVAYLVERIGGDRVRVGVLIQSGQDPHTFEPMPKQVEALGKAKLFFKVDMPFENQLLEKIRTVRQGLVVVDTTEGIKKRLIEEKHSDDGAEPGDNHSHAHSADELDQHVWLSPPFVKIQASNIATALENVDPAHAGMYKKNLRQLEGELDRLDAEIHGKLKPYAGKTFYVFHPAFGYFADRYGLKQDAIEAGGKQPAPKQLRTLIQRTKTEHIKVIFVQPQFDRHSVSAVADAIGARVVQLNDLDNDVVANLRDIAVKIEESMKQ